VKGGGWGGRCPGGGGGGGGGGGWVGQNGPVLWKEGGNGMGLGLMSCWVPVLGWAVQRAGWAQFSRSQGGVPNLWGWGRGWGGSGKWGPAHGGSGGWEVGVPAGGRAALGGGFGRTWKVG